MSRLTVPKTYKLYIGGKFPRTESGRSIPILDRNGDTAAHICHASRKDFKEAVEVAAKAAPSWSGITGYLRGEGKLSTEWLRCLKEDGRSLLLLFA